MPHPWEESSKHILKHVAFKSRHEAGSESMFFPYIQVICPLHPLPMKTLQTSQTQVSNTEMPSQQISSSEGILLPTHNLSIVSWAQCGIDHQEETRHSSMPTQVGCSAMNPVNKGAGLSSPWKVEGHLCKKNLKAATQGGMANRWKHCSVCVCVWVCVRLVCIFICACMVVGIVHMYVTSMLCIFDIHACMSVHMVSGMYMNRVYVHMWYSQHVRVYGECMM